MPNYNGGLVLDFCGMIGSVADLGLRGQAGAPAFGRAAIHGVFLCGGFAMG